jgi:hypothetical protein
VGEVWIISGQSNADWWIDYHDYEAQATDTQWPNLRQFASELAEQGWLSAVDPTDIGWFSALGFFFGEALHIETGGVPVGLLKGAYGGSSIEELMDPLTIAENGLEGVVLPPGRIPGSNYETRVAPIIHFTARGVLWDQGEPTPATRPGSTANACATSSANWRIIKTTPTSTSSSTSFPCATTRNRTNRWRPTSPGPTCASRSSTPRPCRAWVHRHHPHQRRRPAPRNKELKGALASRMARGMAWRGHRILRPVLDRSEVRAASSCCTSSTSARARHQRRHVARHGHRGLEQRLLLANGYVEDGSKLVLSNPSVPAPTQARYMWPKSPSRWAT